MERVHAFYPGIWKSLKTAKGQVLVEPYYSVFDRFKVPGSDSYVLFQNL